MKRLAVVLAALLLLCGCGKTAESAPSPTEAPSVTEAPVVTEAPASTEAPVEETLPPVEADSLREGEWPIEAESDHPLFQPKDARLTVENGAMTAAFSAKAGLVTRLYGGTAAEAESADESACLLPESGGETDHWALPVRALNESAPWAVYLAQKEAWFDCTLLWSADSLPLEAFADGAVVTASTLGLSDGEFTAAVTLSGGSGKAKVASPAHLTVKDGAVTAEICWSSSNYDFMVVDGEQLLPETTEGGSLFLVPVPYFDRAMSVQADTTAMGTPHLIDYTLRFDSATLEKAD